MPPKTKSPTVPEAMQARYAEIAALTDALCRDKLNEEYTQVCREMTATLARKRLSPLVTWQVKAGPAPLPKPWAQSISCSIRST